MRQLVRAVAATALITVLALVVTALTPGSEEDRELEGIDNAQQLVNVREAQALINSPTPQGLILPAEQPPGLDFLRPHYVTVDHSEIIFHARRTHYVVCVGESNPTSMCDADTVTVIRTEDVAGKEVRVGTFATEANPGKDIVDPLPSDVEASRTFWMSVDLKPGVQPWLSTFKQLPTVQPN